MEVFLAHMATENIAQSMTTMLLDDLDQNCKIYIYYILYIVFFFFYVPLFHAPKLEHP